MKKLSSKGDMNRPPKTTKNCLERNHHCLKFQSGPYKTSNPEYLRTVVLISAYCVDWDWLTLVYSSGPL